MEAASRPKLPTWALALIVPALAVIVAVVTLNVTSDDTSSAHTLTADDGSFGTGVLDGGMQMKITIDKPGRYAYHCDIHNYMTGVIEAS
jgi:plastocyanin